MSLRYNPAVFDVRTIPAAKAIILTPEGGLTPDERWKVETPYFGEMIAEKLDLHERHRVLDYGCGVGRLAKDLIERTGCSVIGLDTSVSMRSLAPAYVLSDRFLSCAPGILDAFNGFHHAIAVWSLQHIPDLDGALGVIHQHLRSYGKLFVVNMTRRAIPMSDGPWYDDGKDLREQLAARFREIGYGTLEAQRTTIATAQQSFWGLYQRRT